MFLGDVVLKVIFSIFALIGIIAAASLRAADFLTYFNSESGFFSDEGFLSFVALILILVMTVIGSILMNKKLHSSGEIEVNRNIPLGIISALSSFGFFYASYLMYFENENIVANNLAETTAMGISFRVPLMVLSFLSGVYFIFACISSFVGKNIFEKLSLLPIIPTIFSILFTLFVFMHYSISVLHTENAFLIFSAVLMSFSFLQYAFTLSKINVNRVKQLIFSSLGFSMISLSLGISNIIKDSFSISAKREAPFYVTVMLISAGLYMLSFILSFEYKANENEKPKKYKAKRFSK